MLCLQLEQRKQCVPKRRDAYEYQQIYAEHHCRLFKTWKKTAYDFGNQEIEQEHLLYNLLHQEDSLILKMIEKMEVNIKEHFLNNVENALERQSQKYPADSNISDGYLEQGTGVSGEDRKLKAMGDGYVSVEHLFSGMLRYPSPSIKKLFQEYGITRERFLQALQLLYRGNQRVTSDNPEATTIHWKNTARITVEACREINRSWIRSSAVTARFEM